MAEFQKSRGRIAGRWWQRWSAMLAVVATIGTGLALLQTVQAVHNLGVFELDRNVADDAAAGEDWANIFANTTVASAHSFDTDAPNATIFTGGGSKDDLDTTSWNHTAGSVPDKDDLAHAYAARYGGLLYFGADRTANNGDSQMGFWFFQNPVGPLPNGTFGPAQHEDGDVLVLSDFTKGGTAVTVRVFRWNGPGGTIPGSGTINGTLDLLAGTTASPQDCVASPIGNDNFCATVNTAAFTPPWAFHPKAGPDGQIQKGEFYEGGIDLSFLNLQNECFASFIAETRSSQSVDAVLKDFVGGGFESCNSSVQTTPSDANKNPVTQIALGQSIYDYAVITGTGSNQAPTGTMTFSICNPTQVAANLAASLDPCAAGVNGGVQVGQAVTVNPIANTSPPKSDALSASYTPNAAGQWCWRGVYSGDNVYPGATDSSVGECFQVVQLQPSLVSAQTWTVMDAATVSVTSGAGDLAGALRFRLWNNGDCSGSPLIDNSRAIAGASPQNASSDTLTVTIPGGPTLYSWKLDYSSTNTGHKGITGACSNENGTLTFTNGSTESTP